MPFYEYKCAEHGIFELLRPVDEHADGGNCPACKKLSPRIVRISARFLEMPKERKKAFEINEKAKEQPIFSCLSDREYQRKHEPGCSCCGDPIAKRKAIYTPDGSKVFPSARPWMISH